MTRILAQLQGKTTKHHVHAQPFCPASALRNAFLLHNTAKEVECGEIIQAAANFQTARRLNRLASVCVSLIL